MSYHVKTFVTNSGIWGAGPTAEEALERFLNDNSENIHYIVQIFAKNEGIVLVYKKKDKGGSVE